MVLPPLGNLPDSQNIRSDTAKIGTIFDISKFLDNFLLYVLHRSIYSTMNSKCIAQIRMLCQVVTGL